MSEDNMLMDGRNHLESIYDIFKGENQAEFSDYSFMGGGHQGECGEDY